MTDDPSYIPRVSYRDGWGNVTYCDHEYTEIFHRICTFSAILTLPIDFVGVYFIVKKSSKEMATYKWFLLGHQICISLMDVYMTLIITPEFMFPIWGWKMHGILPYIGFSAGWIGTGVGLAQLGGVLASIMSLFYYRAQVVLPQYHLLKHSTTQQVGCTILKMVTFYAIFYTMCFVLNVIIPAHYTAFMPVDQLSAKREWFQNRVCVQEILFDDNTYVLLFDPEKYYFYSVFYYMLIVIALLLLFLSIPFYFLTFGTTFFSEATRKAQKQFLIALIAQIMVPFLLGLAPIFVYLYVRHWYFERQVVNNVMLIIEALQGSCETLIMLFVTTPFRNAILCRKAAVISIQNSMEHQPSSDAISSRPIDGKIQFRRPN